MILARFLYNLASGILRFVGAIAILLVALGGLFGLLDLIGLGLLAAFPDLIGTTTGSPRGDRITAAVMIISLLGTLGLCTAAGWSISKWIRRCWVSARPQTYRYFKAIGGTGTWRVDSEGVVTRRPAGRLWWSPSISSLYILTNKNLYHEVERP